MHAHGRGRRFGRKEPRRRIAPVGLVALLGFAVGCAEAPTETAFQPPDPQFAKPNCSVDPSHPSCGGDDDGGDNDGGTTSLTGDVVITTPIDTIRMDSAGIYPKSATAVYPVTLDGVDLDLRAACDEGLAIRLDLTDQGLEGFDEAREDCGDSSPRLIVERLLEVTSTTPILLPSSYEDGSTNYGDAHNYYFHIDGVEHDVVWRDGLYAYVTDNGDGTRTYTVFADSVVTDSEGNVIDATPHLADDAEVWYRADRGKPRQLLLGAAVANLELKLTVSN